MKRLEEEEELAAGKGKAGFKLDTVHGESEWINGSGTNIFDNNNRDGGQQQCRPMA